MVLEAKKLMSGSATAFGRLEFLGPFRLQLLHMKMSKVCQDIGQNMIREINFDDVLSLPWDSALCRVNISNQGKNIKKNDSTFEKHDQFLAAVQGSYLLNMFDNFLDSNNQRLSQVKYTDDVVNFILEMLEYFNVKLFYDPSNDGEVPGENEDDLYVYCQVMTSNIVFKVFFYLKNVNSGGFSALLDVLVCFKV